MKARERAILRELMKKSTIPRAAKKLHGDIEDAIAERGGERGGVRQSA